MADKVVSVETDPAIPVDMDDIGDGMGDDEAEDAMFEVEVRMAEEFSAKTTRADEEEVGTGLVEALT